MALVNAFGNLALDSTVSAINTTLQTNSISVSPNNITTKFREAFESYTPNTVWSETKGSGDLVVLDGNAAGASYVVISKDPFANGNVTVLESNTAFDMPIEMSIGLHMSQRTLGQDIGIELTSTEIPNAIPADLSISSITQSTTTLTVTTVNPHGLVPGKRIGISGVSDSRFNYPSLVVATIVTPTQFTATAGPGGTIQSINAGPINNSGVVFYRPAMGEYPNGTSMLFENATATNASIYVKGNNGDSLPSGTATTNHSITVGTTASVASISALGTYAFVPTTEFRANIQADRVQWYDSAIDTVSGTSNRILRTQVVPDPTKQYKVRFRCFNNKSLTVPVAQIVSVTKSGSTTWTVNTAAAHGLTTGDYVTIYGVRDQTNFPNITSQTVVASTPSSTQFTIVSTTGTATSYGGYVSRIQGGNLQPGVTTVVIQSAAVDATTLTLVGNATWAFAIGDYVNVYGCRNNTDGTSMGVDGVYRVRNLVTTTLVLEPIGSTVLPATFGTTNCGGGVIRRTDLRISFVRVFDFTRQRVEMLSRPAGDIASSFGVQVQSTPNGVTQGGTWAINGTLGSNPTVTLVYDSQHNIWANSIRRAVT